MVHDQFIIERLHLRIKRPGEKIDNLRRWEGSVLAEALNHQIQDLRLLKGPCHVLDNRCTHLDEFPNAIFCNSIRVEGKTLEVGDVVLWGGSAAKIQCCGEENDLFFVVLQIWEQREMRTDKAAIWTIPLRPPQVHDDAYFDT